MRKFLFFLILLFSVSIFSGAAFTTAAAAEPPEIKAFPGQVNPYKTRSELLMDAAGFVGVCTPEEAASVWANGLCRRSAAMQYIVMSENLKQEYAKQLDNLNSNWVTGQSSPWINHVIFKEVNKPDDFNAEVNLSFDTVSSAGSYKTFNAKLRLIKEKEFWRIDRIEFDEGLEAYTFYMP